MSMLRLGLKLLLVGARQDQDSASSRRLAAVLSLCIGGPLVLFGGFLVSSIWSDYGRQVDRTKWPQTEATIVISKVAPAVGREFEFAPDLRYRYAVGSYSKSEAEALVAKYSVGA